MKETYTVKEKIGQFLHILFPIFFTQISLYMMNFFDVTMTGKYSAVDLAGVAIGSNIWVAIFTGIGGILTGLTPIVSQAFGAKKHEHISKTIEQAVYVAIVFACFVLTIIYFLVPILLENMYIESNVETVAYQYLRALCIGVVPIFIYYVLRSFMDALGQTKVTMTLTLCSLPLNILLNDMLIFGRWGIPALGGVGAGYATSITYWCLLICAFLLVRFRTPFSTYNILKKLSPISLSIWKQLILIGTPIGLSIFFETSIFSAVTLLMSEFGTTAIAAHQAAMNFASLLYMIPLSISLTLTIIVGFEVGANRWEHAKRYCMVGITFAVTMAIVASIVLLLFRETIASLYTNDKHVLQWTKQFLLYVLFFQLSDAVAAPIQGALRGYKDVRFPFFIALISYWLVGLPVGYILSRYTTAGPFGYWIGLIAGLASGAILLFIRLRQKWKHNRVGGGD
ncbi:MATE family efflux transporter [Anoxybacillus flavithermus]|uniref:Probable multidrug resistance protein NorM n=1 Tax=Anoxybacillus flavithermus TaxID=33934 RepID=A0A2G5RQN9_9BACL|nr:MULTISPECIES: MATE family efflux transporter [Anoxybacillus]KFZ41998.1 multidrug transporter MatE [Anoxybacillus sp. KU2-6(11)]PIC05168.1 MATE family efflux transporter [Anoxybacillus flavithermus]